MPSRKHALMILVVAVATLLFAGSSTIPVKSAPTVAGLVRSALFIDGNNDLTLWFCGTDLHQDVYVHAWRNGNDFGIRPMRVDFGSTEQCAIASDLDGSGGVLANTTYFTGVALASGDAGNVCSSSQGLCDNVTSGAAVPKLIRSTLSIDASNSLNLWFCGTNLHQNVFIRSWRDGQDFGLRLLPVNFGTTEGCATVYNLANGAVLPGTTYYTGVALNPSDIGVICGSTRGLCDNLTTPPPVPTYSISGRIADSMGTSVAGVSVSLSGGATATTDANGNFSFSSLGAGSYTLTPSKSGYTFNPANRVVGVPPDAANQNFTAISAPIDNIMPDGNITSPANGSTIGPSTVSFAADAWDNTGGSGVNRVEFNIAYDGNWHLVGTDTTAPYSINWPTPNGMGTQQLIFTIHVIDNAGNRKMDPGGYRYVQYNAPPAFILDLSIPPFDGVSPVQSVEGGRLVKGKSTAVKVVILKSGNGAANNVSVRLNVGVLSFTRFYVAESSNLSNQNVLINDNSLHPLNFSASESSKVVYFFAEGLTPNIGGFEASATVDYTEAITESNELNNTVVSSSFAVFDTRWGGNPEFDLHFFPVDWKNNSFSTFDSFYRANVDFLKGAFPVSGSRFVTEKDTTWIGDTTAILYRGLDGKIYGPQLSLWIRLNLPGLKLAHSEADHFVAVVPARWFQDNGAGGLEKLAGMMFRHLPEVVFAEAYAANLLNGPFITAHEIGHANGLALKCEEYEDCNDTRQGGIGNLASPGLWVDKRILILPTLGTTYCFMGAPDLKKYWVDSDDYQALFGGVSPTALKAGKSPNSTQGILVGGMFDITGSVSLDNWYVVSNTQLSTLPVGPYAFEYQDQNGQTLHQENFDISFNMEGYTFTQVPFMFTIPYISDTAKVIITHEAQPLGEKIISANPPTVTLVSPIGGERLFDRATIQWEAGDADNNAMSYVLLASLDNGSSWFPIGSNITSTTYLWDVSQLPAGDQYLIKIIATDGVNTSQSISANPFTVSFTHKVYLPIVLNNYTQVASDYSVSPISGIVPLTVTFANTSLGAYTSSLWDFGDGLTSTVINPTHVYMQAGTYSVTLTVSGGSEVSTKVCTSCVRVLDVLPDLIVNGNFEADTAWQIDNSTGHGGYTTSLPHAGQRSIRLGVLASEPLIYGFDSATQLVTIPAGASDVSLSFWYWPRRETGTAPLTENRQLVQVLDANHNVLQILIATSEELFDWQHRTFDLTAYAGKTVYIQFAVFNNGDFRHKRTAMYVDDVSLTMIPATASANAQHDYPH